MFSFAIVCQHKDARKGRGKGKAINEGEGLSHAAAAVFRIRDHLKNEFRMQPKGAPKDLDEHDLAHKAKVAAEAKALKAAADALKSGKKK